MSIVLVAGAIANKPGNAGEAWVRLSWARGLARLGFEVFLLERIAAQRCVDGEGRPAAFEESVNRAWFERVIRAHGFAGRAALVLDEGPETWGLPWPRLLELAGAAELLVDISGNLAVPELRARVRAVFVDLDPGFTQFWHRQGLAPLDGYDLYFTVAGNIGGPGCSVPTDGIDWRPVRQPVVLDDWPVVEGASLDRFTTVAGWRGGFGPVEHEGRTFGLKVHEFRKFFELPRRSVQHYEIALAIDPADARDRQALLAHGWTLVDPREVAGDTDSFRRYVQGSGAEFSVAQGIYVETKSGWFSDRTTRYLASGKPALVQDTGLGDTLPVGEGLVPFSTLDEAVEAAERIARDYPAHRRAARAIAEEWFDSDRVLAEFAREVGVAPRRGVT